MGFAYFPKGDGGSVPANTCFGTSPAEDQWYEYEQETFPNSQTAENGYGNQWLNGTLNCTKSNIYTNGTATQGAQYFDFGQQISSANFPGAYSEYRFISDPIIADAFIP